MRTIILLLLMSGTALAQEIEIQTRPDSVYVERISGDLLPIERVFFHIILRNVSATAVEIRSVRFSLSNPQAALSGEYSGTALMTLFDAAMDRRRIEPTAKQALLLDAGERKAVSDVFLDFPTGFVGDSLGVEVQYTAGQTAKSFKITAPLQRTEGFSGRLPFDGVWYVASEHSAMDAHKRFLAEAFAYDFLQVGANGHSFAKDGSRNADYYAYGKKVLAAKDGSVAYVRNDVVENNPGTRNIATPGGNVVVIDHGNNQFTYYAHLRPNSVNVRVGAMVRAGDPIGEVGNSGDSLEPHLHFHAMNNADPNNGDGIPAVFATWLSGAYGAAPARHELSTLTRGEFVSP